MRDRGRDRGFTLVELLATIAIISVILGIAGYYVFSTINKSKEKSKILAINNVKETASVYIKEYPDEVIWTGEGTGYYACIPTEMLINRGYLKEKDLEDKEEILSYVLLRKNKDGTIISEEFDKNICAAVTDSQKLDIPTSKSVCANPEYTPDYVSNPPRLIKGSLENDLNDKADITGNDCKVRNCVAGEYDVKITLKTGYIWKDNTTTPKTVKCSIKKAKPVFSFTTRGTTNKDLGKIEASLQSNVAGNISYKTSNSNYVAISKKTDTIGDNGTVKVPLEILSTRASTTYITATLKPSNPNYMETSDTYTIGNAKRKAVPVPTSKYCNVIPYKEPKYKPGIYYDGNSHELTKKPCEEDTKDGNCTVYKNDKDAAKRPYNFLNNKGTAIGTYTITARLNYGYVWSSNNNTDDVTITCEIKTPYPTITYENNRGSSCSAEDKKYNAPYGTLCTPSRAGYNFRGWYKEPTFRNKVTSTTIVTNFKDHRLYAKWEPVQVRVTYRNNGGSGCSYKTVTYTEQYGSLCTPSRSGYDFIGWYKDGYRITSGSYVSDYRAHSLDAKWERQSIYMNYNNNGGSGCLRKEIFYWQSYGSLCTPSGGRFIGWFSSYYKNKPLNFYADDNPDVYNHCKGSTGNGYNKACLWDHYNRYGKSEGRRISEYISSDTNYSTSSFTVYAGWYDGATGGSSSSGGSSSGGSSSSGGNTTPGVHNHEFTLYGTKVRTTGWAVVKDSHYFNGEHQQQARVVYCRKCGNSAINYNREHGGYATTGIHDIVCPYCYPGWNGKSDTCIGVLNLNHGLKASGTYSDDSISNAEVGLG